jgi:hypothetical protein
MAPARTHAQLSRQLDFRQLISTTQNQLHESVPLRPGFRFRVLEYRGEFLFRTKCDRRVNPRRTPRGYPAGNP